MALTPETLTRHELNGLYVRVVEAHNPDLVGISGRIVGETMRTLRIESGDAASRVKQVPKRGTTFEFALTDEAADLREEAGTAPEPDGEDAAYVTVDGATLLSRPATRTENAGDTTWR